jgi:26S proteasome regulatory subunit N10
MPLESCMILLDCSQYMRNGDYLPTRFQAQQDAANLLIGAKTDRHTESTIGVAAGTELLLSPTDDVAHIMGAVHRARLGPGARDLAAALAVAALALKHRRNKNGAQRIVLFVGTPVTTDVKALQKVGRQLKKNNVALDVVAMGEWEVNETPLSELVAAANGRTEEGGERTGHLVAIPAGVLPSDVLAASPILAGLGADGGDFALGGGGVDANMDPELAMALRVSMEEERARQERLAAAAVPVDSGLSMEEEALLQQALAMSMNETEEEENGQPAAAGDADMPDDDDAMQDDDDAAMQMALQMSLGGAAAFQDPSFVADMLQEMPDPELQELLKKQEEDPKKKKKDDAP